MSESELDALALGDSDVLLDVENDLSSVSEESSTAVSFSDVEIIQNLNRDLDIILIVLLVWFSAWMLRSWRTWIVKGGK